MPREERLELDRIIARSLARKHHAEVMRKSSQLADAEPAPSLASDEVPPEVIALAEAIGRALARRYHAEAEERARRAAQEVRTQDAEDGKS